MKVIEITSGVKGYSRVVEAVLFHGRKTEPRGFMTLDMGPTTVVMHNTEHALPLGCGRNVSRKVAAVEAAQLIGGFADADMVVRASDGFNQFREKDGNFHGAYGRRIGQQVSYVIAKLRQDRDSRQATVTLWDPFHDNIPGKKDYPCTVALMFRIVQDALELTVTMRSNDVWLGAPYDWFQFTQLQHTVARILDVEVGLYRHTANSLHIYGQHLEAAESLVPPENLPPKEEWEWQPRGFGVPGVQSPATTLHRARMVTFQNLTEMTDSERWYRKQFELIGG